MKNGTLVLLSGLLLLVGCSLRARVEPSKNHTAGRLQKLADNGDPDAQFELGRAYFYGQGVAKDTNVAFRLFTTAANHGSLPAQTALAVMYIEGIGDVLRDLVAGTSWMRRAAGEGYPPYNVEDSGEGRVRITIAVAGFTAVASAAVAAEATDAA